MVTLLYCLIIGILMGRILKVPWRVLSLFLIVVTSFLFPGFQPDTTFGPFDITAYDPPFSVNHPVGSLPQNTMASDIPLQVAPWQFLTRKYLLSGSFPFFNPYAGCGQPLMSNGQSSPFNLFFLLSLPLPFYRSFVIQAFFKILLAFFGTFWLSRALRFSQTAAIFAALAYGLGGSIQGWLLWPLAGVIALYPLQLYLALRFFKHPHFSRGIQFTIVTAFMILAGHPETLFFTQVSLLGFLLTLQFWIPRDKRIFSIFGYAGAALFLTAPFWLPVLLQAFHSLQYYKSQWPHPIHLSLLWLPPFLMTHAFGFPSHLAYWGPGFFNRLTEGSCGFLSLLLAFPFFFERVGKKPMRTFLALQAGIAFLFVFNVGEMGNMMLYIPLFKGIHFRYLGAPLALSLALLAGMGLDHLITRKKRYIIRLKRVLPLFLLIALILYPYCIRFSRAYRYNLHAHCAAYNDFLISWFMILTAVIVLGCVVYFHRLQGRISWPGIALLNGLLLFQGFFGFIPSVPKKMVIDPLPISTRLEEKMASRRMMGLGRMFYPNLSAYYGLYDIRTHDPMANAFYLKTLQDHDLLILYGFVPIRATHHLALLRTMGVGTVWTSSRVTLPKPYRQIYRDAQTKVYHLPDSSPFFSFPDSIERAPLQRHWDILDAGKGVKRLALLTPEAPPVEPGRGKVLRWSLKKGNRLEVRVEVEKPGLLITNWAYLKTFRARCDGRPIPIYPVNGLFMGVDLPTGYHKVEWIYHPQGFFVGEGMFLIGLLLLLSLKMLPGHLTRISQV